MRSNPANHEAHQCRTRAVILLPGYSDGSTARRHARVALHANQHPDPGRLNVLATISTLWPRGARRGAAFGGGNCCLGGSITDGKPDACTVRAQHLRSPTSFAGFTVERRVVLAQQPAGGCVRVDRHEQRRWRLTACVNGHEVRVAGKGARARHVPE
eukprot:5221900-Prymnesium_polylepis.5